MDRISAEPRASVQRVSACRVCRVHGVFASWWGGLSVRRRDPREREDVSPGGDRSESRPTRLLVYRLLF